PAAPVGDNHGIPAEYRRQNDKHITDETMPNVIVLFEVTLKTGRMEDYLQTAATLKEELARTDGFIGSERFASLANGNKLLSKSEWRDEQCVAKWRNSLRHRLAQKHGRAEDFADYKITVVTPLRCYTIASREEAPEDSNL